MSPIPRPSTNLFKDRWIWRFMWRDMRTQPERVALLLLSIILGIAALVAITSFNENLKSDLENQAKALLAADLVLYSSQPFESAEVALPDSFANPSALDARLPSMVQFPNTSQSRLAQVIGIEGPYPFYGNFETYPPQALASFRLGRGALVDENLAIQYNLLINDSIKVGQLMLPVVGYVTKVPGNINLITSLAPSVYIPYRQLKNTALIQRGSNVTYRQFFRCIGEEDDQDLLAKLKPYIRKYGYSFETLDYRKKNLSEAFDHLYRYMNLLSYLSLVLGSIGIACSILLYTKEKRKRVALARSIGASSQAMYWVYLLQLVFLALVGSLMGIAMGNVLQLLIPLVLNEFIPVRLHFSISLQATLSGLTYGLLLTLLIGSIPLLQMRSIPALSMLKAPKLTNSWQVKIRNFFLIALILLCMVGIAIRHANDPELGLLFFGGVMACILFLWCLAILLLVGASLLAKRLKFEWKQAFSNLHRPNNQTVVLVVIIGMCAFLVGTMSLVKSSLLRQVQIAGKHNRVNLVLVDVQPDQKEAVLRQVANYQLNTREVIPVINTRIKSIQNLSIDAYSDSTGVPNWALYIDYPVTYRSELSEGEVIVSGEFPKSQNDSVFVSVDQQLAEKLQLHLGDPIRFSIHGIDLETYVGSIRKVNRLKLQANFVFIFPEGILEKSPKFYAILIDSPTKLKTASFQNLISELFPNISSIDLNILLRSLNEVIDKVAFVIHFMTFLFLCIGIVILISSISNSKYLRIQETVLLRTLGLVRKQLFTINLIEFGYLGFFSVCTGFSLAFLVSEVLLNYLFEMPVRPNYLELTLFSLGIGLLIIMIGWWNYRNILRVSPMQILRKVQ
ncbi:FtsX-like permease family protein [Rapidithrix thailandica]|uniref:FtsX-like permease family protein n=1 Tax=Rapidithrix thailandica TaxID=413964 RepID=A0AAW9S539_9BACT